MRSVLQDWVLNLGLRHQGVLLTVVRGCDTSTKHDPSKLLVRAMRAEFLNCFVGDPKKAKTFIEDVTVNELDQRMIAFLKDCDHYPKHYIDHLRHASEVIGYKKPSPQWLWFYNKMCKGLHVNPETEAQMDDRLLADEEKFGQLAKEDFSTSFGKEHYYD